MATSIASAIPTSHFLMLMTADIPASPPLTRCARTEYTAARTTTRTETETNKYPVQILILSVSERTRVTAPARSPPPEPPGFRKGAWPLLGYP